MKITGNKTNVRARAEADRRLQVLSDHKAKHEIDQHQLAVYALKLMEARLFLLLDTDADILRHPKDWPLLTAEIGITGDTLREVAQAIVDASLGPLIKIGEIEASRLKANQSMFTR